MGTRIEIRGEQWWINGAPTYKGREYRGLRIEGLLLNSRMVQATFDDENPDTRSNWAYPDTGVWDPERNIREFLEAMPVYRRHGLLAVTVNFQGGCPRGYCREQPWCNTAFTADGDFKPACLDRMRRVVETADRLGMAVILGVFYFGQDERLRNERAVIRALDNVVDWIMENQWRHVLIEIANECDVPRYEHEILQPHRMPELLQRVRERTRTVRPVPVGVSFGGGRVPTEDVVSASDFILMHGNGVSDPDRIAEMVEQARRIAGERPVPIVFNEDDHFEFDKPWNNFIAAVSRGASWGYFDPGANNYRDGFQSPPVNWGLSTPRKRAFFDFVRRMTGGR